MFKDFLVKNGTHIWGFLVKNDPLERHIPVRPNMWVPPGLYSKVDVMLYSKVDVMLYSNIVKGGRDNPKQIFCLILKCAQNNDFLNYQVSQNK